jgi:hypothetical protein
VDAGLSGFLGNDPCVQQCLCGHPHSQAYLYEYTNVSGFHGNRDFFDKKIFKSLSEINIPRIGRLGVHLFHPNPCATARIWPPFASEPGPSSRLPDSPPEEIEKDVADAVSKVRAGRAAGRC